MKEKVCKTCGTCPTCGATKPAVVIQPWPYYPWVQPWWNYGGSYTYTTSANTSNSLEGVTYA